jgi:hypothetical protein
MEMRAHLYHPPPKRWRGDTEITPPVKAIISSSIFNEGKLWKRAKKIIQFPFPSPSFRGKKM